MNLLDVVVRVFSEVRVVENRNEVECEHCGSRESPDDRPGESAPDRITRDDE